MGDGGKVGMEAQASAEQLGAIANLVHAAAEKRRGDSLALLSLLRLLESLHREIRDDLFQECLPQDRQSLYALLKDMEAEGGWPYINRMRLRSLMIHFLAELEDNEPADH